MLWTGNLKSLTWPDPISKVQKKFDYCFAIVSYYSGLISLAKISFRSGQVLLPTNRPSLPFFNRGRPVPSNIPVMNWTHVNIKNGIYKPAEESSWNKFGTNQILCCLYIPNGYVYCNASRKVKGVTTKLLSSNFPLIFVRLHYICRHLLKKFGTILIHIKLNPCE